jgi:phosphatidylethanolamine-binding protein (PEBP) family uncharacterized protein
MCRTFRLQSPAFEDGQEMAQKYGKKAQNVSPPLEWEGHRKGPDPSCFRSSTYI